ncbi:uncharacterized protein BO87DRAFT_458884 [Aspergillus neoniger CBS 115656]|uniref:DRBM domain-containing protein n=1 Tax=Aspergillus neoniger (strain CBS 115656) TaxID=1448310 RepID=A0A318YJI8_ASPNB|nr:hypothetical protein BO87DRAFT_458884 [Aspergillus neoniger CBS 115656]PYH34526.1 hypothetical protein BO87DRAFT_458884 [Aspergillus neoniger CBS 115656]
MAGIEPTTVVVVVPDSRRCDFLSTPSVICRSLGEFASFGATERLCRRRHWADPAYESYAVGGGYTCIVRVNNREYQTEDVCESKTLAEENAAMRAYLICRNFSVNDGMYPAGHEHRGGPIQGIPVAIGTGRKGRYGDETDMSTSGESRSGGSSPESCEGRLDRRGVGPTRALAFGQ